jgi:hypothetical protein
MTSEVGPKMVPRRPLLPVLGLAAAAGLALRSAAGEAQISGMERRQERRGERVERRYERRGGTPASKQPGQGQPAQGQAPAQKQ